MTVYVLSAHTVFDCEGAVFSSGYLVGVFDSREKAEAKINEMPNNYVRCSKDYTIEEFEME